MFQQVEKRLGILVEKFSRHSIIFYDTVNFLSMFVFLIEAALNLDKYIFTRFWIELNVDFLLNSGTSTLKSESTSKVQLKNLRES